MVSWLLKAAQGCTRHGDVLLYADGSARQVLRFKLAFAIIRTHSCIGAELWDYTTESLESTLCAVGEQQQKNKLR